MNRHQRRAAEAAHWRRERRQESARDAARRTREQGNHQQQGKDNDS